MVKHGQSLRKTQVDFAAQNAGEGRVHLVHILDAPDEMLGHGRVFAKASLPPHAWFGTHTHPHEMEIYYFLSGEGFYLDDEEEIPVHAGDVAYVSPGHSHGLKNASDEVLEYICLIVNDTSL